MAYGVGDILAHKHLAPLGIDYLALLIHYVIILEYALTHFIIVRFDALLSRLYLLAQKPYIHRNIVVRRKLHHYALRPIRTEALHEFVLERYIEACYARISLTSCPAAELVVNAS